MSPHFDLPFDIGIQSKSPLNLQVYGFGSTSLRRVCDCRILNGSSHEKYPFSVNSLGRESKFFDVLKSIFLLAANARTQYMTPTLPKARITDWICSILHCQTPTCRFSDITFAIWRRWHVILTISIISLYCWDYHCPLCLPLTDFAIVKPYYLLLATNVLA